MDVMIAFSVNIVITACQLYTYLCRCQSFQDCDREGILTNEQIKSNFK